MPFFAIVILALSMSADAFAAAVGRGAAECPSPSQAIKAGAVFGLIEGITPLIGWVIGLLAVGVVQQIAPWIAFLLLAGVGGRMAFEAARQRDEADEVSGPRRGGPLALVMTAVATSLDAAAVGMGLALIHANIVAIAIAIGFSTFCLASLGMMLGGAAGRRWGRWAELAGGLALIGVGGVILMEGLKAHPL